MFKNLNLDAVVFFTVIHMVSALILTIIASLILTELGHTPTNHIFLYAMLLFATLSLSTGIKTIHN